MLDEFFHENFSKLKLILFFSQSFSDTSSTVYKTYNKLFVRYCKFFPTPSIFGTLLMTTFEFQQCFLL